MSGTSSTISINSKFSIRLVSFSGSGYIAIIVLDDRPTVGGGSPSPVLVANVVEAEEGAVTDGVVNVGIDTRR